MQKQAPTLGRMLVMVGFALSCFGLLLFLWLAFGGPIPLKPKGYQVKVPFGEATQLAVEADVRVSGVPVGKVKTVDPDKESGKSYATLQIEERFAPLAKDVKAILRQKTLLGETYVELTPGNPRRAGTIPEGGLLPAAQVSPTVELDEIFRAFDAPTRRAFQTWMQQQSRSLNGRARDISDILGNLDPVAEDANDLLTTLNAQSDAVSRLVSNTGVVFDAISERRGQLQGLIRNNERVFSTTAQREAELRQLFTVFPTFNREAKQTVERLTRFARDTDPLVTQLRPAAREFSPTFQDLADLAPDLRALLEELDPLITASEKGLPALRRFLQDFRPALGEFDPTLKQLNPILSYIGSNRDELRGFFANVPAATQATSPNGLHYLRTLNPLNPENLAVYPRRLGSNRTNPVMKPRGYLDVGRGGLLSFDTRHCGNGNPTTADQPELSRQLAEVMPNLVGPGETAPAPASPTAPPAPTSDALATNIINFMFSNAGRNIPRPRCAQQGPFTVNEGKISSVGVTTQYPQVREAALSTRAPR
jgi:virulence factor Mce-like protein